MFPQRKAGLAAVIRSCMVLGFLGLAVAISGHFRIATASPDSPAPQPAEGAPVALELATPLTVPPEGVPQKKAQANSKKKAEKKSEEEDADTQEEAQEDLTPAALQLDVSKDSPLLQTLYQATRETKVQPTLDRLAEAEKLLQDGADLTATDPQGRTALHWVVFGSSYARDAKVIVAYESLADDLIARGVELNREDAYNDTALDYLLYSPNFEMQTLLIEHGASSGFLAASFRFFDQIQVGKPNTQTKRIAASMKADLSPGQIIQIRLDTPVYSDASRTGDPMTGVILAPVYKDKQLVLPPGTKIDGTVLFAQKAPDKYSRPLLVLDFSNVLHKTETTSPFYSRVIDVDNARETVRNNEILGIVQPHANTKVSIALAAVGMANPIAGYAVSGARAAYGLSLRREIAFPAGTDMTIQIVRPSGLKMKEPWEAWPVLPATPELQKTVSGITLQTQTKDQKPSDLTNLMFIGTEQQLEGAFNEAGWYEADTINPVSGVKAAQAVVRKSGYSQGPVSLLTLNGVAPDLVFQKSLDTLAKRHHIRIWKQTATYDGRTVWVGAATHDIDYASSKKGTKWSHRIDPHIDREREKIKVDLLFPGGAGSYTLVDRPRAPRKTGNATGDEILTDGKMMVLELGATKPVGSKPQKATPSGKK
jgi:hypothetical protein